MTSQSLEETKNAGDEGPGASEAVPLGDAEIAAYLESDPEFFVRHPDLTAKLRFPHGPSGAISLVEHQMAVLRSQLGTERRRLAHLIARAREFEILSGRLHALVLQLISAPDLERIEAVLRESLCEELDAEAVALKLFAVGEGESTPDPLIAAFVDFIDREHALCGPLDAERGSALFGDASEMIQSAALLPIRGEVRAGVLAIGSADPKRFGAEMGTDHLDRLGEVVSRRIGLIDRHDG